MRDCGVFTSSEPRQPDGVCLSHEFLHSLQRHLVQCVAPIRFQPEDDEVCVYYSAAAGNVCAQSCADGESLHTWDTGLFRMNDETFICGALVCQARGTLEPLRRFRYFRQVGLRALALQSPYGAASPLVHRGPPNTN